MATGFLGRGSSCEHSVSLKWTEVVWLELEQMYWEVG